MYFIASSFFGAWSPLGRTADEEMDNLVRNAPRRFALHRSAPPQGERRQIMRPDLERRALGPLADALHSPPKVTTASGGSGLAADPDSPCLDARASLQGERDGG